MGWRDFVYRPRSIYQANALLVLMQFLTACNGFWYHKGRYVVNRWTILYTIALPNVILLALLLGLYQLFNDPIQRERIEAMDQLKLTIYALEVLMTPLNHVLVMYLMLRKTRGHIALYDRLDALDQQLIREFGVNLNYHKLLRKNLIKTAILPMIHYSAVTWTIIHEVPDRVAQACFFIFLYLFSTSGPNYTCYLHAGFAQILSIRFRLLQKLLNADFLLANFPEQQICEVRLQCLVGMVRSFHEIIDDINDVYRAALVAVLLHDFTLVTNILYMLFGHSIGKGDDGIFFAYGAMWLIVPLHKFISAPNYSSMAVEEGKRCLHLVEQIDIWFPNFKSAKRMVDATMHWRLENKIQFTCGFNMIFNRTIIATITAVVFNYLLILIQFRMTQLMGQQIEEQKNALHDWVGDL
ncbi:PREDICTED: putative gustatory receptor 57a [Bactrocera latifrons]|uniref:putative gustatory receptor 57a n=1 Tax=Bactrocera latifrons TaxID=174628 RepID=UPI0008DCB405|nr:PREDICTED: putative gustatory receptor 57a [Bactrocera latifrons]